MPLLMSISGFLFFRSSQKRSLTEMLIHRTQALLQPIIMCGIFSFMLDKVISDMILQGNITAILGGGWINYLNQYWFLWSVLAASIAVGVSAKKTSRMMIQVLLILIGVLFVAMFPNAQMNVFMYPYFVVGFYFAKYKDSPWIKKLYQFRYVSLIVFPVMMLFFTREHYIYTSGFTGSKGVLHHMPTNIFRWIIGFVGCVFILTIFESIVNKAINREKPPCVINVLGKIGEKSLQIYVLSCIFLSKYLPIVYQKVIGVIGGNIFAEHIWVYTCMFTPLLAAVYSGSLLLLVNIFERIKINKLLFGRK